MEDKSDENGRRYAKAERIEHGPTFVNDIKAAIGKRLVRDEDTSEGSGAIRRMPIERGPPIVNDFKAWVGRKLRRSSDE